MANNTVVDNNVLTPPDLASWRKGNTGTEGVWQFKSERPGRHVLITALIHGNELCGAWALRDFLDAQVRPSRGTLTLAFCNLAAFDRFDPGQPSASRLVEEDLNRVWSDDRLQAGDTLERRRAAEFEPFVKQADWLLDLHSMHEPSPPLLLPGVQPRNLRLARALGAPAHVVVDAGHKNGVRMRDYGKFGEMPDNGTQSLLIECGTHLDPKSAVVARDMVARFLCASEVMSEPEVARHLPGWQQPLPTTQMCMEVTHAVVAVDNTFRFTQPFTGLEVIETADTVIGSNGGQAVTTPYDHCVLVMPSIKHAAPGITVVRFARALG